MKKGEKISGKFMRTLMPLLESYLKASGILQDVLGGKEWLLSALWLVQNMSHRRERKTSGGPDVYNP